MILHCCKFAFKKWGMRGFTIGQLTLIFISPLEQRYWRTLRHENIHRLQFKECGGIIKTLKIYYSDRKKLMIKYDKRTASKLTRFEQEAYTVAGKLDCIISRKEFAWQQYKLTTTGD